MIDPRHPDFLTLSKIRDGILSRTGGSDLLTEELPNIIKNAVDFVLDPVRTARTKLSELDKVEKTFIGLKIEHYLRDWLDVPKGLHRDLLIDGLEVDIKNTVGSTWMIPPETYRNEEPCLLIATAKFDGRCWLGLVVARNTYLNAPNRDGKRSVNETGKRNIMWLVEGVPYPPSRWEGIDIRRFRELRKLEPGTVRAAQFFRENIGRPVHRSVVQALLHDQKDYMKRLRFNGGARDLLAKEGIRLLSRVFDAHEAEALGYSLDDDEFLAVKL